MLHPVGIYLCKVLERGYVEERKRERMAHQRQSTSQWVSSVNLASFMHG